MKVGIIFGVFDLLHSDKAAKKYKRKPIRRRYIYKDRSFFKLKIYYLCRDIWSFLTGYRYWDNYITRIGVKIGKDVAIAPGVKIISRNHDIHDIWMHGELKPIIIGDYCWIGANAVILPGVILGNHTIVGAGSIVTKSFPEGYCIVVGNPAKKIKDIDPKKCKENQHGTN